jgi:hypothetical protein
MNEGQLWLIGRLKGGGQTNVHRGTFCSMYNFAP